MDRNDGLWLRLVSNRDGQLSDEREGAAGPRPPTVFVVDDDPEMRRLLVHQLEPLRAPVATFGSAEEFLAAYAPDSPGCMLLDLRLPGMDGFALQGCLKSLGSALPVIFVTGYADVASARYALLAGAADFLQKPVDRRTLLDAVEAAFRSDRERRRSSALCARLSGLSAREWDVLRLVVAGRANKVISAELEISQKTVEAHRARVMSKTGADSVPDLVRMFSAFESQRGPAASNAPRRRGEVLPLANQVI